MFGLYNDKIFRRKIYRRNVKRSRAIFYITNAIFKGKQIEIIILFSIKLSIVSKCVKVYREMLQRCTHINFSAAKTRVLDIIFEYKVTNIVKLLLF